MRFATGKEFLDWPSKAVTIFGMSGVGKTTLARLLQRGDWFQYSVDYRIGTRYMGEHIVDNFKREAMKVPFLRQLLLSDSIYICSNITFENLSPLSTYLGKPGDPAKGGIPFAEYKHRQHQHREAEMGHRATFPNSSRSRVTSTNIRISYAILGGSLCEVVNPDDPNDPVLRSLADHTLMLYIEGNPAHTRMLVERFRQNPKPMYYQPQFLETIWAKYLESNRIADPDTVDPDDFAVWGFEQLLHHRIPLYQAIARNFGYSVKMEDIPGITSEAAFLKLVSQAIQRNQ